MLVSIIFLVGCASNTELESALAEIENLESQMIEKDSTIDNLENQIQSLTDSLKFLQSDYDALQEDYNEKVVDFLIIQNQSGSFLCDVQLENMKYENSYSALAILDGWFALQPQVGSLQGTYSTQFWDGIESKIHTIRYISTENDLTTTESFMVFIEEAGWKEGILWLDKQCWLDYPH
jgi:uncharacterized coiled-coil protein SlyX